MDKYAAKYTISILSSQTKSLRFETSSNGGLVRASNVYLWNGLLQLISVPPGCSSNFRSYPRRLKKIAFTPEDFHKMFRFTPEEYGPTPGGGWGRGIVRLLNAIPQLRFQINVTKVEKFVRFSEPWRPV